MAMSAHRRGNPGFSPFLLVKLFFPSTIAFMLSEITLPVASLFSLLLLFLFFLFYISIVFEPSSFFLNRYFDVAVHQPAKILEHAGHEDDVPLSQQIKYLQNQLSEMNDAMLQMQQSMAEISNMNQVHSVSCA